MLTPEQERQLTGGQDIDLHSHKFDRQFTIKNLGEMQEIQKAVTVTANYTATYADNFILVDSTSGVITITLPFAKAQKELVIVRVKGSNNVTVAAQSPDTVNGAASTPLTTPHSSARFKAFKTWSWNSI